MSWQSLLAQADAFAGDLPPFHDFRQVMVEASNRVLIAQHAGDIASGTTHRAAFAARVWETYQRRQHTPRTYASVKDAVVQMVKDGQRWSKMVGCWKAQ